jgi:alcohol dehydrogenase (cytochrome c)
MRTARFVLSLWIGCVVLVAAAGPGLAPAELLKPLGEQWTSYSGDYTGRRYSSLTQINQSNVQHLTLAWAARLTAGLAGGPTGPAAASGPPIVVGGEGSGDVVVAGATTIKGTVLAVNGVLYVTAPDNIWALDAHDGHTLWRYF